MFAGSGILRPATRTSCPFPRTLGQHGVRTPTPVHLAPLHGLTFLFQFLLQYGYELVPNGAVPTAVVDNDVVGQAGTRNVHRVAVTQLSLIHI